MRKLLLVVTIAAVVSLGFGVSHGLAAPALTDKPVKYEFAELRFTRNGGGGWGMANAPQPGGQGGERGPGGGLGGQAVPVVTTSIKFSTGEEEIEAGEWKELADKLRAPAPKKEVSTTVHKLHA